MSNMVFTITYYIIVLNKKMTYNSCILIEHALLYYGIYFDFTVAIQCTVYAYSIYSVPCILCSMTSV